MARSLEKVEVLKKTRGKRYANAVQKLREVAPKATTYQKAIEILTSLPKTKFDESVHVSFRLGVDPKQSDQMVRGALVLPHGLGKSAKVVVFAKGEKATEATKAGADEVGADDLATKILGGYLDFSAVVATPDMMAVVSKVARVLGPKGLMPNPKLGTVTQDVGKVIGELKKGRVEYRVEKAGIIQCSFGKLSFGAQKLTENFKVLAESVVRAKPSTSKGNYILSVYVSTSMGPSVQIENLQISQIVEEAA